MADNSESTGSFFSELRRRKVIKTCALYLVACWVILQMSEFMAPAFGLDDVEAFRFLMMASVAGFPVTFALAWFFQITSSGIDRKSTRLNSSHSQQSRMPSSA